MRAPRESKATGRELQVLELAAEGNTDKQIALILEISKDTVASYWRRILLKYDAVSRTEVVARHAREKALASVTQFETPAASDSRLRDEVDSRTRAQASELAQRNLVQAITECSMEFISGKTGYPDAFEHHLNEILGLTQSEYGFLAEVKYDEAGAPYIKTHAITNIAWNKETRGFYDEWKDQGLEFRNLETLFGRVLTTRQVVYANDPTNDPRRGGLPPGHPAMTAFLGIPVFNGEEMVGMIGIANRPGGYDEAVVEYLSPMVSSVAQYILGVRMEQVRRMIEQHLTESAILIRTLTDAMPTAFLFEDGNRRLQYVNRPFLKIFGSDGNPMDFIGADCAAVAEMSRSLFVNPDDFMARVDELLEDGEDSFGDIVRLTNGQVYERDFVVVRQADQVLGYLWKYHNVSAWRSEHETLTRILGAAMDAVIVIDCQGRVEFWNTAAESIFGYSEAEAMGEHIADLIVPPEYRAAHRASLERFMKTRVSHIMNQIIKITALHQDGDTLDVELSLACIDDGPEPRYSAFIRPD